jgi:HlyD family secretion protein
VKRWIGWAIAAIVIAGIAWWATHRGAPPQAAGNAAPAVDIATVREAPFEVVLDESGTVGPPAGSASQLAFPNAGVIGRIDVHVGERVSAGEPLAALRTQSLALAAEQAAADERSAQAQAESASVDRYSTQIQVDRAALARAQRLYAAGVDAQKDVQSARAQLATDQAAQRGALAQRSAAIAQMQSAAAKAQLAQTDLTYATLVAPVPGVVTAIMHRPGEAVDASTPVIAIGPADQHETTLRVPASDAAQMHPGDPVVVSAGALGGSARGRLTAVVPAVDPATQTATVTVDTVPPGASAGAAVRARVTVASVTGMVVPQAAIVADPQSGNRVVFVQQKQKDGSEKFVEQTVSVAHENGSSALLTSGVHPGDRIAAQGAFQLLAPAGGD